nr:MAG TPA: hypothetical protein [Caudoviricetes sp.]
MNAAPVLFRGGYFFCAFPARSGRREWVTGAGDMPAAAGTG